jgi:hypothetical protein
MSASAAEVLALSLIGIAKLKVLRAARLLHARPQSNQVDVRQKWARVQMNHPIRWCLRRVPRQHTVIIGSSSRADIRPIVWVTCEWRQGKSVSAIQKVPLLHFSDVDKTQTEVRDLE